MSGTELPVALGLSWGVLAAAPIARRAGRTDVASRFATSRADRRTRRHHVHSWLGRQTRAVAFGPVGRVVGGFVRRRVDRRRDGAIAVELPVTVDLLAVAIGAGYTPYLAIEVAAQWAPPLLAARLDDVRRACALGAGFAEALDDAAEAVAPIRPLVDALLASDRYGAPVADALERLATEERAGLRRRAEARARKIPVLLLFPLVFLVLPAFGLLTVAPVLLAGFAHP